MKSKIIKINWDNPNLYCIYSKERITIGEKYILIFENYLGEWIEKAYKLEYKDYIDK